VSETYRTLVSVPVLNQHLKDPAWSVVDCRHDLTNTAFGRAAYGDGHIEGAIFIHMDDDLSGPKTGTNGRHPLPDAEILAARLGALGIGNDTQVIAYDDASGMYAARLWCLLRWLGHDKVAVLDGGFNAWCDASLPLTTEAPQPRPKVFLATPQLIMVDADFVEAKLATPDMRLIDARSPDRFRGENERLDPVGGHIPGAKNRFFRDNLAEHGCFKPAARLREEFDTLLRGSSPSLVVHQCGSGVTACHNMLAMEHAGLSGSRLYAGSWSEWCANPQRPIATGPA